MLKTIIQKNLSIGYRDLVIGTNSTVPIQNDRFTNEINFDNAATTPPFKTVLQELVDFAPLYASVHRGAGFKSEITSRKYEEARYIIMDFLKADPNMDTVIFVKNTTEGINKLSNRLKDGSPQDVVLCTQMEHHSNLLPWRNKFLIDWIEIDEFGRLDLENLIFKLQKYKGKVKLVAVTGASNVTGYMNPVHKIAELAHRFGAKILVDGAQLIPHAPFEMKPHNSPQHIDFLTFSAHKMYAPFGTGVLIGPKEIFQKGYPDYSGGGTVRIVTDDLVIWDDPPHKDEAGTPNALGVIALTAAIQTLIKLGLTNIYKHERRLTDYAYNALKSIPGIELYSHPGSGGSSIGVIPFNLKGIHHEDLAYKLSYSAGISVRNGCFCAQPYVQKLLKISQEKMSRYIKNPNLPRPGMVRISFGLYNDFSEIDILIDSLKRISRLN